MACEMPWLNLRLPAYGAVSRVTFYGNVIGDQKLLFLPLSRYDIFPYSLESFSIHHLSHTSLITMREETTQEAKEFLSSFPGLAQLATEDGRMFKIESARYLVRPSVKVIAGLSTLRVPN